MPYYGSYDASPRLGLAGKGGYALALVAFVAYTVFVAKSSSLPAIDSSSHGVCFPSVYVLLAAGASLSHWLNIGLIIGASVYAVFITKHYNFVPSDNLLYATSLLLMCTASPWTNFALNDGVVMLWVVLICIHILFSLYGRKNCSEGIFLIFALLSWGSMVEYGFLLMMPVFLFGAILLRAIRFREILAMFMGIAAPYWIVLAMGFVEPSELQAPTFSFIPEIGKPTIEMFRFLLTMSIVIMLFLLVLVVNLSHRGSAGVMVRARWSFLQLLGFASMLFIFLDFNDMVAYMPILFLCTGYGCAQWEIKIKPAQKQYLVLSLFVIFLSLSVVFEALK